MEGIPITFMREETEDLTAIYNLVYERLLIMYAKKQEDWRINISVLQKDLQGKENLNEGDEDKIAIC